MNSIIQYFLITLRNQFALVVNLFFAKNFFCKNNQNDAVWFAFGKK